MPEIADIERRLQSIERGFQSFEKFQRQAEVHEAERRARADERDKSMERWMVAIDKAMAERKENDRWVLRIVTAGVLVVVVNFVLGGGLSSALK